MNKAAYILTISIFTILQYSDFLVYSYDRFAAHCIHAALSLPLYPDPLHKGFSAEVPAQQPHALNNPVLISILSGDSKPILY